MLKALFSLSLFFLFNNVFAKDRVCFGNYLTKSAKSIVKVEEGIQFFEGDWKATLDEAKLKNKPIFLDAYTSWCKPCKLMEKNTFTQKIVGDFFNTHFINFKMDMEKNEEGERLAQKYRLSVYPSLFVVNANEELIDYKIGYLKGRQLIAFGKRALKK
jgi:thiol:disulfide interchange protein